MDQDDPFLLTWNGSNSISEDIIENIVTFNNLNKKKVKALIQIFGYSLNSSEKHYHLSPKDYLIFTEDEVLICCTDTNFSVDFQLNFSKIKQIKPIIYTEKKESTKDHEKIIIDDINSENVVEIELYSNQSKPIIDFFAGDPVLSGLLTESELIIPADLNTPKKTKKHKSHNSYTAQFRNNSNNEKVEYLVYGIFICLGVIIDYYLFTTFFQLPKITIFENYAPILGGIGFALGFFLAVFGKMPWYLPIIFGIVGYLLVFLLPIVFILVILSLPVIGCVLIGFLILLNYYHY